jgi:hypothetical protein
LPADDVTDAWRAREAQWLQFARAPGHDVFYEHLNLPWFAQLLPAAGRRTLDVRLREPRASADTIARHPDLVSARDTPFSLQLRCRQAA